MILCYILLACSRQETQENNELYRENKNTSNHAMESKQFLLFDQKNDFKILSGKSFFDYSYSDLDTTYCKYWTLSEAEIISIIRNSELITGTEWHYLYSHLPCNYTGALEQNNCNFEFAINGGSWLTISNSDTSLIYGDASGIHKHLFMDEVWNPEEIE